MEYTLMFPTHPFPVKVIASRPSQHSLGVFHWVREIVGTAPHSSSIQLIVPELGWGKPGSNFSLCFSTQICDDHPVTRSTFILCIRKGDAVSCKSDLPTLYKYKDIGFEDFEDSTKHNAESSDDAGHKEYAVESMRWYSAGKGLKVFSEIKAKIAAGERFELSPNTIIQIRKELDVAIKDLVRPAKDRLQFHLAWSE